MKETTAKKRGLSSDRIFDIFNYALMAVIMIVVAYPLYYVLIASISNPYEVYAGHTFLLPADITFEGYARVFKEPAIAMGYLNSIWYTVLGTVVTVAMTITTGYCMSKKTLPFRRAIMLFFVFTMYFNGGLIPTYLVVSKLQLLDSVWALILPGGISVYNVIVTRTFFETMDCQHFFRQIFLGYFSDIVQAFDTLRKNVCGDDYTSLHNPIVLSSVLPAYGMFHSIQILFL